jgi:ATP-dependent DNA ligase
MPKAGMNSFIGPARRPRASPCTLFDLLTLRGESLTREPQERRRELLRTKVMPRLPESIRNSETLERAALVIANHDRVEVPAGV